MLRVECKLDSLSPESGKQALLQALSSGWRAATANGECRKETPRNGPVVRTQVLVKTDLSANPGSVT